MRIEQVVQAIQSGQQVNIRVHELAKVECPPNYQPLKRLKADGGHVFLLAPMLHGRLVSGCPPHGSLIVWDVISGMQTRVLDYSGTSLATLSEDRIACASHVDIKVVNVITGGCELTFAERDVETIAALSNNRLVSGSKNAIKIWNITTQQCERTLSNTCQASFCTLPNDLIVSALKGGGTAAWNDKTGLCEWENRVRGFRFMATLSDARLVSIDSNNIIRCWRVGDILDNYIGYAKVAPHSFANLGNDRLAVECSSHIQIWNIAAQQLEQTLLCDNSMRGFESIATLPNDPVLGNLSNQLVSGHAFGAITIWSVNPTFTLTYEHFEPILDALILRSQQSSGVTVHDFDLSGLTIMSAGYHKLTTLFQRNFKVQNLRLEGTGLTAGQRQFLSNLLAQKATIRISKPLPSVPAQKNLVKALWNFAGQTANELSFLENDILLVLRRDGEWIYCRLQNQEGWAPANYVEPLPQKSHTPEQETLTLIEQLDQEIQHNAASLVEEKTQLLRLELDRQLAEMWSKVNQTPAAEALISLSKAQKEESAELQQAIEQKRAHINCLNEQLNQLNVNRPDNIEVTELRQRIQNLERQVAPLQADYEKRMLLQNKLEALFRLDENDPRRSLETFYWSALSRLTAFAIALKALDTGLIARSTGWKDDLVSSVFTALSHAGNIAGTLGSAAFGAGAVIPLVMQPILVGGTYLWSVYRENEKKKEFASGSSYFHGGFKEIDEQNSYVAFGLTYLLQIQLPLCTHKGGQQIINNWLGMLVYNIMKQQGGSDAEAQNIVATLLRMDQSKASKQDIITLVKRGWNSEGLWERAGITYSVDGIKRYESCYEVSHKNNKTVITPLTRANKYGYLSFPSEQEAILYKKKAMESLMTKDGKHNKTLQWRADSKPLGPEPFPGDCTPLSAGRQVNIVGADLRRYKDQAERQQVTTAINVQQQAENIQQLKSENETLKKAFEMLQKQVADLQLKPIS